MEQNVLLKELYPEWFKENHKQAKAELQKRHPEITSLADQTVIQGYETYAVLVTKEDREPLIFFAIDYAELTLIAHYA